VVQEATRASHDDVGALAQGSALLVEAHAAVDGRGLDGGVLAQTTHGFVDLLRQFPGGRHYEHSDAASLPRLLEQPLEDRQHEGRRLAGTRLGGAEDVAALQGDGDGPLLDGGRFLEAHGLDRAHQSFV